MFHRKVYEFQQKALDIFEDNSAFNLEKTWNDLMTGKASFEESKIKIRDGMEALNAKLKLQHELISKMTDFVRYEKLANEDIIAIQVISMLVQNKMDRDQNVLSKIQDTLNNVLHELEDGTER